LDTVETVFIDSKNFMKKKMKKV